MSKNNDDTRTEPVDVMLGVIDQLRNEIQDAEKECIVMLALRGIPYDSDRTLAYNLQLLQRDAAMRAAEAEF